MGAGPLRLLGDQAVPSRLVEAGLEASVTWLDEPDEPEHETGRVFELDRRLAREVAAAGDAGRLPAIVAGNCISCLGTLGGIAASRVGILWLDAHPDFHTPETTPTGFLDGTGLSAATGACWTALCASIPGFAAVGEEDVVLAGIRDIDPGEDGRLASSRLTQVPGGTEAGQFDVDAVDRAVAELAGRVDRLYLHIDLDVVDPEYGKANGYAVAGGLTPDEVREIARNAAARVEVGAVAFTAYDPSADGSFANTAADLLADVAASVAAAGAAS
jgi:arginase